MIVITSCGASIGNARAIDLDFPEDALIFADVIETH